MDLVSNNSTVRTTQVEQKEGADRRKKQFIMFVRILMKYLEQKDPQMFIRAKEIICDCAVEAKKNKRKKALLQEQQGYCHHSDKTINLTSISMMMKANLRATVGEQYWKRAKQYFRYYQKQKYSQNEKIRRRQIKHNKKLGGKQMNKNYSFIKLNNNSKIETFTTRRQWQQPPKKEIDDEKMLTFSFEKLFLSSKNDQKQDYRSM